MYVLGNLDAEHMSFFQVLQYDATVQNKKLLRDDVVNMRSVYTRNHTMTTTFSTLMVPLNMQYRNMNIVSGPNTHVAFVFSWPLSYSQ